ncbi:MAG: alpha/beta fold hydrolase [Actinomycetota bacterium]|nr:alpha/beta fold hydrolase [Actinomycetota bacterium]
MPVFERDGLSFHYLDEGDPSGRPFVFQHGLGGDVSQPAGVFSPPPGIRLLSLDCRGHGGTYPLGGAQKLSFSCFADDVAALMDYLGLERAGVGGISMGAGVALNLALRHPARVAGLVLSRPAWLDSPMPGNLKAYPVIARLLREYGTTELGREHFEGTEEYTELERAAPRAGRSLASSQFGRSRAREFAAVLESLAADAPGRDRAQWREVRVPALVLASWQDPIHPHSYAEILARTLPSAQFAELTSKTESEESHAADTQVAIAGFLDSVFRPAAPEEAPRR